ncbi:MAG: ATP-binding cassette domain-containing protein [Niastella sp.]|uniref:ABC transporter ATP-binding protein n=1 Tax=Niastella sp. TaxID=1869183 RepID=UPI00389A9397
MKISLINAGKRFNRDWIFRELNQEFISGTAYAITGPNGSGKSTLLQAIGGAIIMSEGSAKYTIGNTNVPEKEIEVDKAFQYISIAAPYLELIEEMTLLEMLEFHSQFKPLLSNTTIPDIISTIGLKTAANKQIRFYSSGMKQRVKLAQAIFSDVPCVLLDEPCTNLDAVGIELYHQLIRDYGNNRLIIVSSNDPQEYSFCKEMLSITDYKKVRI